MFSLFKKKPALTQAEMLISNENIESAKEFKNIYMKNTPCAIFGRCDGQLGLGLDLDTTVRSNDLLVIHNSRADYINQIVVPTINNANLSYIIYDPNGEIYGKTEETLRKNKYDIRVIDFKCGFSDSTDRIDMFELVNVTERADAFAKIVSSCFQDENERHIAEIILLASAEYILDKKVELNITRIRWIFNQIKNGNKEIIDDIMKSEKAKNILSNSDMKLSKHLIEKTIDHMDKEIFPIMERFGTRPSIYGVLMAKRHTAIFVRGVDKSSSFISTTLLYNLMVLSSATDDKKLNTLVIDTIEEDWHDRVMVSNWLKGENKINDNCMARMFIREEISDKLLECCDPAVVVLCSTTDNKTLDWSLDKIEKQYKIAEGKGRKLSNKIKSKMDLENLENAIVISGAEEEGLVFTPFRCSFN